MLDAGVQAQEAGPGWPWPKRRVLVEGCPGGFRLRVRVRQGWGPAGGREEAELENQVMGEGGMRVGIVREPGDQGGRAGNGGGVGRARVQRAQGQSLHLNVTHSRV